VSTSALQSEQPVIRCEGLTKWFGGVLALDGISFEIRPGELIGLVGDNGAGKSTVVKILSGVHKPDAGELWIGDTRVTGLTPPHARELGIETVYQDLALCDTLDAVANVMLGQEPVRFGLGPIRFINKQAALEETKKRMGDVGATLSDYGVAVRRLSGGQRQAVAIARATAVGNRLIIFDEPTAALGVRQTKTTLGLVRRVADAGVAVIVVSHNLDDVFAIASRVVALRLGRIVLDAQLSSTSREEVVACMTGMSFQTAR